MERIFVYDCDRERLMQISAALSGYDVWASTDLMDSVRRIQQLRPAVVLSDWHDSDGSKLLVELKRIPGFTPPLLYFMDRVPNPDRIKYFRRLAIRRGAAGFIELPTTQAQFLLAVERALFRSRMFQTRDELREYRGGRVQSATDPMVQALEQNPYSEIADLCGGWDVLNRILEKHQIRRSRSDMMRLRRVIISWGSLRKPDQFLQAVSHRDRLLGRTNNNPVKEVIFDLAQAIIFGQHDRAA